MSDALPLPPRPNLEHYKKLAKDFRRADASGDPTQVRDVVTNWLDRLARLPDADLPPGARTYLPRNLNRLVQNWARVRGDGSLSAMHLFIARAHGFKSWRRFADHVRALASGPPDVEAFEAAADAIADGDTPKLKSLLAAHPKLARQRSTREHRSTLLHYVSANGIEDFRQRTPQNIVEITKLLLDAGADVNAKSDAYGGGSLTLGLVATSYHPDAAGVQGELMQLLIDRGAHVDYSDIMGILNNGRGPAAQFFAARASHLALDAAAGAGRLDLVKGHFESDGRLRPPATRRQLEEGFALACQFGHSDVVEFLLRHGVTPAVRPDPDTPTGLHWAAFSGRTEIVGLLLAHGAPVAAVEARHGGTPLGWAFYGWINAPEKRGARHPSVVAQLVRAGATIDLDWFADDRDRSRALAAAKADPLMSAALRGESLGE